MKAKKKLSMVLALVLMLCLFTGFSTESAEASSDASEREVTVTDMSGDEVTIKGEVNSIVNLWPGCTTSFFAMGAGDIVKGLAMNGPAVMNEWTQFFYPACKDIPALGGIEPTVEELIKMDPDLVIVHPSSARSGYAKQIRDAGIPAINIFFQDFDSMIKSYTVLGEILGGEYQSKLDKWCKDVEDNLEKNRGLVKDLSEDEKPVVYYIAGQTDSLVTTMGAGSIMEDWIVSNGGVFASSKIEVNAESAEIVAEELFKLNPDIIVVGGTYQASLIEQLKTTAGWKDLDAVKNGRVYGNPFGCYNWDRFGVESYLQINYALLCIQPEIAEANGISADSMKEEIIDFYQTMNGKELTDQEADNMLNSLLPDGSAPTPQEGKK